ncbi:MAG: hypothetical protein AAF546_09825 [Verrucomicrobiota bacterium]
MSSDPKHTSEKVDLDELLALKKAERPSSAVWDRFDRELHQRMLQSLMKKDPWYLQILSAFSRPIGQGLAISSAVAMIAVVLVRTILVTSPSTAVHLVQDVNLEEERAVVSQGMISKKPAVFLESVAAARRDYGMETYSASDVSGGTGFERDFGMDRIETATYDVSVYSADSARSHIVFANTSVASISF